MRDLHVEMREIRKEHGTTVWIAFGLILLIFSPMMAQLA
jgi:hypothetical protein